MKQNFVFEKTEEMQILLLVERDMLSLMTKTFCRSKYSKELMAVLQFVFNSNVSKSSSSYMAHYKDCY